MSNVEAIREAIHGEASPPPVSGLAIAALTLGVLTVGPALLAALVSPTRPLLLLLYVVIVGVPAVLAIIFGHIAFSVVNRGERRGRALAVWGFTLGYLAIVGPLLYGLLMGLLGYR